MSDLTKFRDYSRVMAQGGHSDECVIGSAEAKRRWGYFRMFREWEPKWGPRPDGPPRPCEGDCVSAGDRALFARLAAEVDEYLAPQPDLFGEMTAEPAPTEHADRVTESKES